MSGRLVFLLALAASWLLAIVFRLYDLQVLRHDHYAERAEKQQQRVVRLDPPRGTLYDARGRELAVSVEVSSVAVDPSQVTDPAATAEALAKVLQLDRQELGAALASGREFVWLKRKLEPRQAEAVKALALPGVIRLSESKRYYPLRTLAAQVLGYVGTDNAGLGGIEFLYDRVTASKPGRRTVIRDARLGTVLYPNLEASAAEPGRDLRLTLDAAIQYVVERELAAAVERHHARRGSVVVMDPRNGAILAMASYPGFDPNHFTDFPEDAWRNQVVMDAYEPGSTFKMVTAAAALEEHVFEPTRVIDCGMGGITLHRIRISDHKPFGLLTLREVIAKSSNVGAIKIGLAAGRQRLYDTIRAFGFGQPTGIDLPSESSGLLHPLERWSGITPAYISFGQGLSITSLQLTAAFAAIANGGYLLRPYIVAEIGREGEPAHFKTRREVRGVPVSAGTIRQLTSLLASVVSDGTGKKAAVPGYPAAGKTGTAQKAIGGSYSPNKFVASFVGFAPLSQPAVVCAVVIDEPWPLYHGGDAAAPVFAAIVEQALLYLGVEPEEREIPTPAPPAPEVRLASLEEEASATATTEAVELPPLPPGSVPDFAGLSAREGVQRAAGLGLATALHGHGKVERQLPVPGTALEMANGTIELWLSPEVM